MPANGQRKTFLITDILAVEKTIPSSNSLSIEIVKKDIEKANISDNVERQIPKIERFYKNNIEHSASCADELRNEGTVSRICHKITSVKKHESRGKYGSHSGKEESDDDKPANNIPVVRNKTHRSGNTESIIGGKMKTLLKRSVRQRRPESCHTKNDPVAAGANVIWRPSSERPGDVNRSVCDVTLGHQVQESDFSSDTSALETETIDDKETVSKRDNNSPVRLLPLLDRINPQTPLMTSSGLNDFHPRRSSMLRSNVEMCLIRMPIPYHVPPIPILSFRVQGRPFPYPQNALHPINPSQQTVMPNGRCAFHPCEQRYQSTTPNDTGKILVIILPTAC